MLPLYLPDQLADKYTPGFLRRFVVALVAVGTKMASGERFTLASVGEQFALRAIVTHARTLFDSRDGREYPGHGLDDFESSVHEDEDFELLFSGCWDGIESSPIAKYMGMVNLGFDDWFTPFAGDLVVHPYIHTALPFPEDDAPRS
jgi:hypothetical protein